MTFPTHISPEKDESAAAEMAAGGAEEESVTRNLSLAQNVQMTSSSLRDCVHGGNVHASMCIC